MTVGPTLRCLRDDLRLPVPSAALPLDQVEHPLLAKASEQFADPDTPHERIRAIDDVILFKVKVRRWRGAVHCDAAEADVPVWLVSAGIREDGSADDFYAALEQQCRTARQRYNASHDRPLTTDTHSQHLLPDTDDHERYRVEFATRFALRLNKAIVDLVLGSLRDGHEHALDMAGFRLGVQVRADDGHETYVAIRITGSVPPNITAVILHRVPGGAPEAWFPESSLPERELMPAEQVWSNLMDPKEAARLLENDD
ncbi:hypothetical protein DFR70_102908 [Nocardia tenerifensis]|uniref:Uncharacterized protein n=1 Tax=Nocardia tenerifensis TaxID=228006 RepID=A0A318KDR3_9NOCA|nr:hypothetical protein [Nocardia tenerifensis]PXX69220.1 hypothetical protein DFR70_102908 [Nocardia tenerifensis]